MDYIRIDPLIDNRPKMFRAGWWACRVFELMLKVSGKYDLRGQFTENYAEGEWLAREWNYTAADSEPLTPGESIQLGLDKLVEVGLLERVNLMARSGQILGYGLTGWEEFYGKKDHSTDRVRKYRANRAGTADATGETDETDGTPHTPHTPPTALMEAWNQVADAIGLAKCIKLAGEREKLTVARLREQPDLGYWKGVAARIAASTFCCGQNDRGWKASYDWFVHPLTHAKVMEGKYDNRSSGAPVKLVTLFDDLYGKG